MFSAGRSRASFVEYLSAQARRDAGKLGTYTRIVFGCAPGVRMIGAQRPGRRNGMRIPDLVVGMKLDAFRRDVFGLRDRSDTDRGREIVLIDLVDRLRRTGEGGQ